MIDAIVAERRQRGPFTNLKDFISRTVDADVNKRAIENFIKAGALDGLGGTRKQFMSVYVQIADRISKDKKSNLAGQISLFDIAEDSQKDAFDIKMPDVGEYSKEMLLGFEKEVLGIYLSGHPLEEWQELWQKYATATTNDFALDEETGQAKVEDQKNVILGGMIADKTIKYTKNDKVMAFLNLEDLVGNVEVVIFPKDYEKYSTLLLEDAKIFIKGRASVEEDKDAKLICEQIVSFEEAGAAGGAPIFRKPQYRGGGQGSYGQGNGVQGGNGQQWNGQGSSGQQWNGQGGGGQPGVQKKGLPKGLWIQFQDAAAYREKEQLLLNMLADSDGKDDVIIFLRTEKKMNLLPPNRRVNMDANLVKSLQAVFGEENVKTR